MNSREIQLTSRKIVIIFAERTDMNRHHVLTLLLDGKPTLVPLKDNIQVSGTSGHRNVRGNIDKLKRVLDVGTGTGGFVESGEINPTFYSDDGTIDDVEALQTWNKLVIKSGKGFGRSFTDIENDVQLFREAGLVDVKSFDFKAPIGGWPKDEKMRKVGQFLRASIENDLEGYTMMAWHHIMSWPKDEYQVFLMNMRKAFKDKRIHGYMRVRYVYDRKPDVEE
ncbi:hypothetical protein BFJ65_g12632 [Fusarium oxysporum f. sp. cepae]|uniref:Methyltransferase n=1 Tax=Fusarium oxysporum f. sp. cepae TaxID=396571 RepID=A0A3L6N760_FUSOX|nr:hypothetical protein BFJ65_g12632 [Fusarium oxysporum f. sp. cepae]